MLFSETPLQAILHGDSPQIAVRVSSLQFIQHMFDLHKDHLTLAGDFPSLLRGLDGPIQVADFQGLSNVF